MEKIFLNLAGEFAVAGELNRRHVLCSVTYGAAKSADIFAFSDTSGRMIPIEVKSTRKKQWPVGQRGMNAKTNPHIWVFVWLPTPLDSKPLDDRVRGLHAPRFFVMTGAEVELLTREGFDAYSRRYQAKHGAPYPEGIGVPTITLAQADKHEGAWGKILTAVGK